MLRPIVQSSSSIERAATEITAIDRSLGEDGANVAPRVDGQKAVCHHHLH
jgi:hypothetical protein